MSKNIIIIIIARLAVIGQYILMLMHNYFSHIMKRESDIQSQVFESTEFLK